MRSISNTPTRRRARASRNSGAPRRCNAIRRSSCASPIKPSTRAARSRPLEVDDGMSGVFENVDVAVIGGGISGLAAAHALRKAGQHAIVLEASPSFGGVVGSVRQSQYL